MSFVSLAVVGGGAALGGLGGYLSSQDAKKNSQDAANAQIGGIQAGYNQLSGLVGQGNDALTSNYSAALQPFLQNLKTGQQGTTAYGNAVGLNGPAGNASATQAFWNNPAIQSQLNVGSENVLRNNAATGQLNSGKTNIDLQNLGQQTASQGWGQYLQSLAPFLGLNQSSAAGAAGVQTGLGSALNANNLFQGQAAYGSQTSMGNAQANADLAKTAADANIWNGIMGGASLGAGFGGGGSLFGGFGGGASNALAGSSTGGLTASMFSDERLKEDISPVGELYDGTNVYSYRYKGDATPRIGVMAQEIERVRPDAVTEIGGFKAVDYAKATEGARDYAAAFGRFMNAA